MAIILIADDDRDILDIFERTLKEHHHIYTAENGLQAIEVVQKHPVDLAILDYQMPEMSGGRVADVLININLPYLFISGTQASMIMLERHSDLYGCCGIMTKPLRTAEIKSNVEKALARTRKRHIADSNTESDKIIHAACGALHWRYPRLHTLDDAYQHLRGIAQDERTSLLSIATEILNAIQTLRNYAPDDETREALEKILNQTKNKDDNQ